MGFVDTVNRFFVSIEGFTSLVFSASLIAVLVIVLFAVVAAIPFLAAGNALGILRFGTQYFTSAYGRLPARKRTWGTVFDARTLRPLPFVMVELRGHDQRVLESRVTDEQGRYGFLATPDSLIVSEVHVYLSVVAPNHVFPAKDVNESYRLMYGNVYTGQSLTVRSEMLIGFDIPVEPTTVKDVRRAKAPTVRVGIVSAAMADAGLWVGTIAVPLAFLLVPNPFTLGFLFLFLGTVSLRLFGIKERPYGTVTDTDGIAIPFALLTVHDTNERRVAFAVTDERGRYFLSLGRGRYTIRAHAPANISPPRTSHKDVTTTSGWVTEQFTL
jgi:hypothetical protein